MGCAGAHRPDALYRLMTSPDAAMRAWTAADVPVIPPTGMLFTFVHAPLSLEPGTIGDRKGTATAYRIGLPPGLSFLIPVPLPAIGMFAWGDASQVAAARNGRITRITHVDYGYQIVLFVFQSLTVEVYGTGDAE